MRTTWIFVLATFLVGGSDVDRVTSSADAAATAGEPAPGLAVQVPRTVGPRPTPETRSASTLTPEQADLVAWAHSRYEEAGLDLPHLDISFDPSRAGCGGAEGLYVGDGRQTNEVTICIAEGDTAGLDLLRRRTLLHEFAHAWDRLNLDDEDRARLLMSLGTEVWIDATHELRWEELGVERLAETFVHGLLDQPRRPVRIAMECRDLVDAFEAATGRLPLGPGLPWCMPAPPSPGASSTQLVTQV